MKKGYFLAAIAAGCWATLGIIGRFIYATLILGETLSLPQWLGVAVVVAGVCILNLPAGNPGAAAQVKRDVETN